MFQSNSGERALQLAFREIKQIAERLNLPKIIAVSLYNQHFLDIVNNEKSLSNFLGRSHAFVQTSPRIKDIERKKQ